MGPRRGSAAWRALLALVLVGSACSGGGGGEEAAGAPGTPSTLAPGRAEMAFPDATFPTGDPGDPGLRPETRRALDDLYRAGGAHCVAVLRDGVLVHERYWDGYTAETDQEVFSATKSVTSILVGIAQDQGLLDIDDPVAEHVPEWRGTPSEAVRIRNLLSNDSGRRYEFATDYVAMAARSQDKTAFAVGLDQEHPPGTYWAYNNSAIQVLEEVLEAATGQDVARFAERHLFEPIGMTAEIRHDAAGNTLTFMGMQASCRDLARFGHLALNEGRWDGDQIVSADYVREATQPSQQLNSAYGFLWWLNSDGPRLADLSQGDAEPVDDGSRPWPDAPPDTFAAQGLGGQLSIVVPSEGLVVTRLGPGPDGASVNEIVRILVGERSAQN